MISSSIRNQRFQNHHQHSNSANTDQDQHATRYISRHFWCIQTYVLTQAIAKSDCLSQRPIARRSLRVRDPGTMAYNILTAFADVKAYVIAQYTAPVSMNDLVLVLLEERRGTGEELKNYEEPTCPIGTFAINDSVMVRHQNPKITSHVFCKECLGHWWFASETEAIQSSCPMCHATIFDTQQVSLDLQCGGFQPSQPWRWDTRLGERQTRCISNHWAHSNFNIPEFEVSLPMIQETLEVGY